MVQKLKCKNGIKILTQRTSWTTLNQSIAWSMRSTFMTFHFFFTFLFVEQCESWSFLNKTKITASLDAFAIQPFFYARVVIGIVVLDLCICCVFYLNWNILFSWGQHLTYNRCLEFFVPTAWKMSYFHINSILEKYSGHLFIIGLGDGVTPLALLSSMVLGVWRGCNFLWWGLRRRMKTNFAHL